MSNIFDSQKETIRAGISCNRSAVLAIPSKVRVFKYLLLLMTLSNFHICSVTYSILIDYNFIISYKLIQKEHVDK